MNVELKSWFHYSERRHHDVPVIQLTLHRYTSAQSFFILKQGYMFRLKFSHLGKGSGNENVVRA